MLSNHTDLIRIPRSGYFEFFKRFMRDELAMFVGSVIATALFFYLLDLSYDGKPPNWIVIGILPWIGPLLEKPWMLSAYVLKGFKRWKHQEQASRLSLTRNIRNIMEEEEFFRTLRADILYHDSFYVFFMFLFGLMSAPESGAASGIQAALSFLLAVIGASYFEVQYVEIRRRRLLNKLTHLSKESDRQGYGEFRLLIPGTFNPAELLHRLKESFDLKKLQERKVQDFALTGASLPSFNEWDGHMQVRQSGDKIRLHVVFTTTRYTAQSTIKTIYLRKEKIRIPLEEASLQAVRKALGPLANKLLQPNAELLPLFDFRRTYASGPVFSFAVDDLEGESCSLLEVKFWGQGDSRVSFAKQLIRGSIPSN